MSNRLKDAASPYLLQHKDNPVDWYPWGEEAFARAEAEDRPVFLSIGYSTCHWCHVMAHESFEDEEVARLMNETFVSIKVDREERPDIDGIYMSVCQLMTGQGGWPLTIVMTPDRRPFYAATYVPRESRMGRIGMLDLVPRVGELWQKQRERVEASAEDVTGRLVETSSFEAPPGELSEDVLERACAALAERFDPEHGGFGDAPKFPSPHNLLFLLRYAHRTGDPEARHMAMHTLDRMRLGGVFDHVGFGFHRYSTDRQWTLPHFEKMLYDQAMLAMAYTDAFLLTGEAACERTAREVLTYVLRDLAAPEGAFYAAEDADSEGREGKFYVWTTDELEELLGEEDARLVERVYNLRSEGNFEEEATRRRTGENILHLRESIEHFARREGEDPAAFRERIDALREKLFEAREERVRPGLDDKILTDWNGLMIAALARAARAFGEPAYRDAARRAAGFVLGRLRRDGRLLHRYRAGEAGIAANLDDHAYLIWGLIELYEATFEVEFLEEALALADTLLDHFWDTDRGGFYFTPDDGEALIVRRKELFDGALPSGNALATFDLLRLARLTGRSDLEERAHAVARVAAAQVERYPAGFTGLLVALDFAFGPAHEVVLAGEPGRADWEALRAALDRRFLPRSVVLHRPAAGEAARQVAVLAPFTEGQAPVDGKAAAYVCRDHACERPTADPEEMLRLLGG